MSETTEITCPNCRESFRAAVDTAAPSWVTRCHHCRAVISSTKASSPLISGLVERTPYVAPEPDKFEAPPDGTEVRCDNPLCGKDLIGKWEDNMLHIKYRERSVRVEGIVWVPCRRCNKMVMIDTSAQPVAINAFASTLTESDEPDATPAAITTAEELGINIYKVDGTGKDGRITQPDVVRFAEEATPEQRSDYIGWQEN